MQTLIGRPATLKTAWRSVQHDKARTAWNAMYLARLAPRRTTGNYSRSILASGAHATKGVRPC